MNPIKIGVFGCWRGQAHMDTIGAIDGFELVAVADKDDNRLNEARNHCNPDKVQFLHTFDELLDTGIEAVVLCDYFTTHAEHAIKAMERGVAVLSECTAAHTLKGCVELCRAVERTGGRYMLGENYPFSKSNTELARLARSGILGKITYGEGEYNHSGPADFLKSLTPEKYHWRAWLARTYYSTHALGPLMYMGQSMPKYITAHAVHSDVLEQIADVRHNDDALGMMCCEMDDGSLFRFTGCTAMASNSGYRIVGERGSAETGRFLGEKIGLHFNHWEVPEGEECDRTYDPEWPSNAELADRTGHGGGDFWVMYDFLQYLRGEEDVFFDVYRACAMSACGILGWRSCLEHGKMYKIPDFRNEEERKLIENDDLSPFPDENGNGATLPASLREAAFFNA